MSASFFSFSLATPLLFLGLSLAQLGAWRMWRAHTALLALGLGFGVASMGMFAQLWGQELRGVQYVWTSAFAFWLSSCAYLLAAVGFAWAAALRLCVAMPWMLITAVGATMLWWANWNFQQVAMHPLWTYGMGLLGMAVVASPLLHWAQLRLRNRFDHWLRWLYATGFALAALRVVLGVWALQAGASPAELLESWRVLCTHLLCMTLGLAVAGGMFFAVLSDVLSVMNRERQQDPLTELLNRRGFAEQALQQCPAQAQQQWALLVCDLDHFKQVNDRWGHLVGDDVLRSVAQLLKNRVRATDVVARFGGEEFVLLLPGRDARQAQQVAERIREGVAQLDIPALQGEHLTVSIGAVQLTDVKPAQLEQALKMADAQMYAAKRHGRNCVMAGVGAAVNPLAI